MTDVLSCNVVRPLSLQQRIIGGHFGNRLGSGAGEDVGVSPGRVSVLSQGLVVTADVSEYTGLESRISP